MSAHRRVDNLNVLDQEGQRAARNWIADFAALAVKQQGGKAFSTCRRSAAYHEAGHVLLVHLLGLGPESAEVFPDGPNSWGGWTAWSGPPFPPEPPTALQLVDHAAFLSAGAFCEWKFVRLALAAGLDEQYLAGNQLNRAAGLAECDPSVLLMEMYITVPNLLKANATPIKMLAETLMGKRKANRYDIGLAMRKAQRMEMPDYPLTIVPSFIVTEGVERACPREQ